MWDLSTFQKLVDSNTKLNMADFGKAVALRPSMYNDNVEGLSGNVYLILGLTQAISKSTGYKFSVWAVCKRFPLIVTLWFVQVVFGWLSYQFRLHKFQPLGRTASETLQSDRTLIHSGLLLGIVHHLLARWPPATTPATTVEEEEE